MRRVGASALLVASLVPSRADATTPCPRWGDRDTMACMRAYVRIDPAAVRVGVKDAYPESYDVEGGRSAYEWNVGAGMFHAFGKFGLAAGLRFGSGSYHVRWPTVDVYQRYLNFGPEVRAGWAGDHVFVHALLRTGLTRWTSDSVERLTEYPTTFVGWHVGGGVGVWARLGRRFLLGGEAVMEVMSDRPPQWWWRRFSSFSALLSLGVWL